ncbi:hypothetical protein [Sinorhizobium meliloti]|uniref:hypothetical protein n=1 Tax=Rhizobium meliloti TaxID=382 RepID=UPI000FD93667|nr:hypothetical protein [Sinorhizobium meliloti]RVK27326.1 hypothetical protein CN163_30900 [Sinorhizobium meliloti]
MEALYFPHLKLPEAEWTNPNLLFFDKIEIIAPGERYGGGYLDYRTQDLIASGLVRPCDPEDFARDDEGDEVVLGYIIGQARRRRSREVSRIHIGKLAYSFLPQELQRYELLRQVDSHNAREWLEGPRWVIDHLMTVIAIRILARREGLSLITSEAEAKKVTIGSSAARTRNERRIEAVSRLLPVGADVDLRQIVRFKEAHGEELRRFRRVIDDLVRGDVAGDVFRARMNQAEQLRAELIEELRTLDSRVPGIDIALSAASLVAPIVEQSPFSAAVAATAFGCLVYRMSRQRLQVREIRNRQMMYAALVQQHLTPRDWRGPVHY